MKERFEGANRPMLIRALLHQDMVHGNSDLAASLASTGQLVEFGPGAILITEGDHDNDVYLLIAGNVAIVIKGQQVASRKAGNHVGEMAALEPGQPRAATVVAEDTVVAVKLSAEKFTALADNHPQMWQSIGRELARRLYQRNDLLGTPNPRPRVFIISSVEALEVARHVEASLKKNASPHLWTNGVFFAGGYALEMLEDEVERSDFAVAVSVCEDIVQSRGEKKLSLRDNVLFELGLFMGRLGRRRSILVHPRNPRLKIPSDLQGLTTAPYSDGPISGLAKRLSPACEQIRDVVKKFGVRPPDPPKRAR